MGSPGKRFCSFLCERSDSENASLVLQRYACVDPDSVEWRDGRLRFWIDLVRLPDGDGPAMQLRIERRLQEAVSQHVVPGKSEPPKA